MQFAAEWSGYSTLMIPILENLADIFVDQIKFCTLDVEINPKVTAEYEIRSLPTIILFKEGKLAGYLPGSISKKKLEAKLKSLLSRENH